MTNITSQLFDSPQVSHRRTLEIMHNEINDVPNVIERIATYVRTNSDTFNASGLPKVKRVCIVGHGANLYSARIMDRSLAKRGIGARFADPRHAICLEDELLICLTRTAANDDIMQFLKDYNGSTKPLLLTANAVSEHIPKNAFILDLNLAGVQPGIATESVFAIVMLLDTFFSLDTRDQCISHWQSFASKIKENMEAMQSHAERQARALALADRLFLMGNKTLEDVGRSLSWTFMETSDLPCSVIPLTAGRKGPLVHLGHKDCILLLGREGTDDLFKNYRTGAGYSLQLTPPPYTKELGVALYTLLQGQLLALELGRSRGV